MGERRPLAVAAVSVGTSKALGCNPINNLPARLYVGWTVQAVEMPVAVHAALIAINLGPDLS